MTLPVLAIAFALYAASAAAYVLFFARPRLERAAAAGYLLCAAAFAVHAIGIGVGCSESGGFHLLTLRGGFGLAGWIAAGAFLLLQRAYRVPAAGAFALPLVVTAILPAIVSGGAVESRMTPEIVRLPALKVHVAAALGGVALFALASGVALMYLLQDRELKGKRFGALFTRLPSLDVLDRMTVRLVALGFAVFTVALVTGSLLAKTAWCAFWEWDGQQVASVAIWSVFGAVVYLRRAGLRGRLHAAMTMAGFALVLAATIGLRQIPGATRHQGDFQQAVAGGPSCPAPPAR
jgi:HemX protein